MKRNYNEIMFLLMWGAATDVTAPPAGTNCCLQENLDASICSVRQVVLNSFFFTTKKRAALSGAHRTIKREQVREALSGVRKHIQLSGTFPPHPADPHA
nr:hypothetical protein [Lachnospiraceae bacterium]